MSEDFSPDYIVTAADIIRDAIEVNGFVEPSKGFLEGIVRVALNTLPANALIDTLVDTLEQCKYEHEQGKMFSTVREKIIKALAEAKKWKGEA
jgi:hypothetical protein